MPLHQNNRELGLVVVALLRQIGNNEIPTHVHECLFLEKVVEETKASPTVQLFDTKYAAVSGCVKRQFVRIRAHTHQHTEEFAST